MKYFLFPLFVFLISDCGENEGYLYRIYEGENDDGGVNSGYVDERGDTIVPLNKYYYCYTDTVKHYGAVLKHDGNCVAIDRNGKELYGIYWYDNGPDYLSEGLFRIIKNGKIGYADEKGRIVIEPQFECADPFENGKARVTYDCELVKEGEYTMAQSTSWVYIDKKGRIINN